MNAPSPMTATSFEPHAVAAARSVIIELWQILGAFQDAVVLVGGWVPELLLPGARPPHTGSLDVDLLLNPQPLRQARYVELLRLLEERGYGKTEQPFKYRRMVTVETGQVVAVDVDFLVPRGARKGKRGAILRTFRAIDADWARLALEAPGRVVVDGVMPDGARNRVEVGVTSIAGFLVMKAFALHGRLKEKDAYDIWFCLRHWPGGPRAVAALLRPHRGESEVVRAMQLLGLKFRSVDDFGPQAVATFVGAPSADERAFVARDAFERVQALLGELQAG